MPKGFFGYLYAAWLLSILLWAKFVQWFLKTK